MFGFSFILASERWTDETHSSWQDAPATNSRKCLCVCVRVCLRAHLAHVSSHLSIRDNPLPSAAQLSTSLGSTNLRHDEPALAAAHLRSLLQLWQHAGTRTRPRSAGGAHLYKVSGVCAELPAARLPVRRQFVRLEKQLTQVRDAAADVRRSCQTSI